MLGNLLWLKLIPGTSCAECQQFILITFLFLFLCISSLGLHLALCFLLECPAWNKITLYNNECHHGGGSWQWWLKTNSIYLMDSYFTQSAGSITDSNQARMRKVSPPPKKWCTRKEKNDRREETCFYEVHQEWMVYISKGRIGNTVKLE